MLWMPNWCRFCQGWDGRIAESKQGQTLAGGAPDWQCSSSGPHIRTLSDTQHFPLPIEVLKRRRQQLQLSWGFLSRFCKRSFNYHQLSQSRIMSRLLVWSSFTTQQTCRPCCDGPKATVSSWPCQGFRLPPAHGWTGKGGGLFSKCLGELRSLSTSNHLHSFAVNRVSHDFH